VDGTLCRSKRERSDGGTASPVAEELAGVRERVSEGGRAAGESCIFEFGERLNELY
jgi:hypothetical protein